MSANRLIYDKCAYNQQVDSSIKPLEYVLDNSSAIHCNPCRITHGTTGGNQVNIPSGGRVGQIDLESQLFNLNSRSSKCEPCENKKINNKSNSLNTCELWQLNKITSMPQQNLNTNLCSNNKQ